MNTLKNISIQNFRGINNISISDFVDVNLLIGDNNCGKTSILESIFLLVGVSNPMLAATVNQIRGLFSTPQKLKLLFHNVNLENNPKLSGEFSNNKTRELVISAKKAFDLNHQTSDPNIEIEGIDFDFFVKKSYDKKKYKSSLDFIKTPEKNFPQQFFPQVNFAVTPAQGYKEELFATILPANKNEINLLQKYSELVKQKKNGFIVDLLQGFDRNIKSIQPLHDGIYFELAGASELLPLNVMGGGISYFLNMATSIAVQPNSIVCIDEIENGLHFSKYNILWRHIFNIVKENNSQLFITTHSVEILKTLADFLANYTNVSFRNMAKVFTIANTAKAGYKAYDYSYEGFSKAISQNIELRS